MPQAAKRQNTKAVILSVQTIKAYQLLNAQMENYMQNGKINPVAGIFLMKNNMGYADKQEVVLTPNQQLGEQVPAEDLEKKYLEDVVGASGDYDSED